MAECCRCCFASVGDKPPLAVAGVNWGKFLAFVRFHRVEGMAWNAIAADRIELSPEVREALSTAATEIAAESLVATAESHELLRQFDKAGVPLLFIKGITVGALAYANPAIKAAVDIDLLIDPGDAGRAAGLLRASGYKLIVPAGATDQTLGRWHRHSKESVWLKEAPTLQVDLHTRTADTPRLIPGIDVHSPRQWVRIDDRIELPTLAADELFAYLAVHGAWSAWFRLKWIADFAGMLHARSAYEIERMVRRSRQLGAGRAAGQALLVADALFGTLRHASDLRRELKRDRGNRWLCGAALRMLSGEPREPTGSWWGTLPIHGLQLLLQPGLAFKFVEPARQARQSIARRT
jgi:hypothetical protein